jgi:hypothetical protein
LCSDHHCSGNNSRNLDSSKHIEERVWFGVFEKEYMNENRGKKKEGSWKPVPVMSELEC